MIRYGTIAEVDHSTGQVVVQVGDVQTAQIHWLELRAGKTRTWSPKSVGEQVMLLCPESDLEGAIVLGGVNSDAFPAPGNSARELTVYEDGAELAYDPEGHVLDVKLPAGATVNIVAVGGVTIDAHQGGVAIRGDVSIEGDLSVQGDAHATGTVTGADDVIGGGKSLKGHKHPGVTNGGGVTGAPQ